jgi:hypothetical protein
MSQRLSRHKMSSELFPVMLLAAFYPQGGVTQTFKLNIKRHLRFIHIFPKPLFSDLALPMH